MHELFEPWKDKIFENDKNTRKMIDKQISRMEEEDEGDTQDK